MKKRILAILLASALAVTPVSYVFAEEGTTQNVQTQETQTQEIQMQEQETGNTADAIVGDSKTGETGSNGQTSENGSDAEKDSADMQPAQTGTQDNSNGTDAADDANAAPVQAQTQEVPVEQGGVTGGYLDNDLEWNPPVYSDDSIRSAAELPSAYP